MLTSHMTAKGRLKSFIPKEISKETLSALDMCLLGLLALVLGLQFHLQFVQKINWDEFFYLSHIYMEQDDRLGKVLQMAHAYLFGGLTHIPGGEISQIRAGRLIMWGLQFITLGFIVRIGRELMSLSAALFSALSFICLGFVFIHGTSFRADPLAATLMTYAIYVFTVSGLRRRDLLGLACALGLGALVTIKVILFAPLLAILAIWRLSSAEKKQRRFIEFGITILGAVFVFAIGYLWQVSQLPVSDGSDSPVNLAATFETVFKSGGLFPRWGVMKAAFAYSPIPILMTLLGFIVATWTVLMQPQVRRKSLICLALALPLLTFMFYRNAYPYFFSFILPPVILLAGYAIDRLKLSHIITGTIAVMMAFNIGLLYADRLSQSQDVQAQTLEAIHEIFPEAVTYFDRNGFVSSFPKAGFFMSSWGLRNYVLKGEAVFVREMEQAVIPLVIDNSPAISAALKGEDTVLIAEDARALGENYIPHWGHIWVAGKDLIARPEPQSFEIKIPGQYTIESEALITINSLSYMPGQTILLKRGGYVFTSDSVATLKLRWGDNIKRPETRALEYPIFTGF